MTHQFSRYQFGYITKISRISLAVALSAAGVSLFGYANAQSEDHGPSGIVSEGFGAPEIAVHQLNPHSGRVAGNKPPWAGGSSSGISYHGGPLITAGPNVYVIWYGNWSGNSATTIIPAFLSSIGGSPYFNINATYYNGSNVHVANRVAFVGSTTDNYSQGTSLSDGQIQAVVSSAITSLRLPKDLNGVYFVLTSADVTASSGFCTQYCGWHTHGSINGSDIKYSFVGNPDRCLSACQAQTIRSDGTAIGPNGNVGADGMVSIIAHELEEATTDPDLNAWYDTRGQENADKCAWTFGTTYKASNGAYANMKLGTRDYLIQQNWVNNGSGYCALSY